MYIKKNICFKKSTFNEASDPGRFIFLKQALHMSALSTKLYCITPGEWHDSRVSVKELEFRIVTC